MRSATAFGCSGVIREVAGAVCANTVVTFYAKYSDGVLR